MNHSFDIDHARKYGIVEAILITNFQFWIAKNKACGRNFRRSRTWTYNSVRAYAELFPYLTADRIRRAIHNLIHADVLMSGNFNDHKSDQTKWYAFVDESQFIPGIEPSLDRDIELTDPSNSVPQRQRDEVCSYVYVLRHREEIVYVGFTGCIEERIAKHRRGAKVFDSYTFDVFKNVCDAINFERHLIRQLAPKYNKQIHSAEYKGDPLSNKAVRAKKSRSLMERRRARLEKKKL